MAQTIAPRISAFAIYQRTKEEKEREEKRQADKAKNINGFTASKRGKENTVNGIGKTKPKFKNFSIRLHDLAYSPLLKHKIGTKRKRLLRQRNNLRCNDAGQKRRKLGDDTNKIAAAQKKGTNIVVSEVADSTVQLCQVEQCWKSRRPFIEAFDLDQYEDSRDAAKKLLKWLIYPVECGKFLKELWERKPLLLKRHRPYYNNGLFSSVELDRILRENFLEFSLNIDVTRYHNGKRETYNPEGRAHASVVWDYYQRGCSVRLLNPQTYSKAIWKLNATLQEIFGSCVGANVYLTPPGTQGFAPHYDDIEAFVLQLEGRKKWKLYFPRNEKEILPRFSSGNFNQEEISDPILDITLESGDMLYFPRGTIHQAYSLPDTHSLHITVSASQRNSWGDLLEKLIPMALSIAMEQDKQFRESLPTDYMEYMGIIHSADDEDKRSMFGKKLASLMSKLLGFIPVDEVADTMAAKFMHDSLPPCLTEREENHGVWNSGARWNQNGVDSSKEIQLLTQIKLVRYGVARVVTEKEGYSVYYTTENSRVYHEKEPQYLDLDEEV